MKTMKDIIILKDRKDYAKLYKDTAREKAEVHRLLHGTIETANGETRAKTGQRPTISLKEKEG